MVVVDQLTIGKFSKILMSLMNTRSNIKFTFMAFDRPFDRPKATYNKYICRKDNPFMQNEGQM